MVQIIYIMNNGILQLSNTRYDDGVFNILRSHCQLVSNSQLHRLEIPKDCSTCPFPRSLDVCWLKLTCSIASISPFFAGPGMTTLRWEPIASAILSQFWVGWNYGGSFCIDKKKHCCFTMSRTSWSFAGYNLQLEQVIIKLLLFSRWGHRCHYKCLAVQNAHPWWKHLNSSRMILQWHFPDVMFQGLLLINSLTRTISNMTVWGCSLEFIESFGRKTKNKPESERPIHTMTENSQSHQTEKKKN